MTTTWFLLVCNIVVSVALVITSIFYQRILKHRDESDIELLDLMDRVFERLTELDPLKRDEWSAVRIKLDTHRAEIIKKSGFFKI